MDWNGVEERYELERRKDKLVSQLEEAASLWKSINKRTGLIAGYIQQNLFYQVGGQWAPWVQCGYLPRFLMDVTVSGCGQFPPLYRTEGRSDPRTQGAPRANKRGRNSIEDSQTCQEIK